MSCSEQTEANTKIRRELIPALEREYRVERKVSSWKSTEQYTAQETLPWCFDLPSLQTHSSLLEE